MLQPYLFNEQTPKAVMIDPERQEVVYYLPKETNPFWVVSIIQHLTYMFAQSLLVVIPTYLAIRYFQSSMPLLFALLVVLFLFPEQLKSGLAVIWYGILKKGSASSSLGLALFLLLLDSQPSLAQYDPPDSVGNPTDIGAQMTYLLTWAPIDWSVELVLACFGAGLCLATLRRGLWS